MSSERNGGRHTFCCDTCGEVIDTEENEFNAALGFAKGEGWRAYPVQGVWCHACPDCKEDRR